MDVILFHRYIFLWRYREKFYDYILKGLQPVIGIQFEYSMHTHYTFTEVYTEPLPSLHTRQWADIKTTCNNQFILLLIEDKKKIDYHCYTAPNLTADAGI